MFLTVLDQFWVRAGLKHDELRRERGRGIAYAVLMVTIAGSAFLAADLVWNFTGRFG